MSKYKAGDKVIIQAPKDNASKKQCDWVDDMTLTIGLLGLIAKAHDTKINGIQRYTVRGVYQDGHKKGREFAWNYMEGLLKTPSKFRLNQGKRRRKKLGLVV